MGLGLFLQNVCRKYSVARWSIGAAEAALFGTGARRSLTRSILRKFYDSSFRRKWLWQTSGEPHFTDHDYTFFRLYDGTFGQGVYSLARAMNAAEHVKHGAKVLDIGCGDGGFTKRFLSPKASHVDAVDIEPSAIETANKNNAASNVTFRLLDATSQPLPSTQYDLIVMDGVLGHMAAEPSKALLNKIATALAPGGFFCGSETLGHEGHDHLQFFETESDLRDALSTFEHIDLRTLTYDIAGIRRREAIWTCRQLPN